MKRTPLKRGTKQLARSGFKQKNSDNGAMGQGGKKKPATSRTKPVKAKQKTISSLKKKLWKLFSLFIRERDNYTCVTCGKQATGSGLHSGHFITGATCTAKLYFDETNVHAQCYHCNINLSGNWVRYEEFMIKKYGKEHVENLKLRRTLEMGEKVSHEWYEDKIKHYDTI